MLERLFKIQEKGSSVRVEVLGGITTFVTMAYIIVVNPAILSFAGIPVEPSTVATIVASAFGCALMGFYANRPFAVAPYMGENAFIAFGLASLGISWQQRLGSVFLAGVLFLILTLIGARTWLAQSISPSLKHSFAVGIGMFLTFIGLYQTGIVTSSVEGMNPAALLLPSMDVLRAPDVPVKMGNIHSPTVLLAIGGFFLISVLMYRKVRGGILIGMVATALAGYALGLGERPDGIVALPFVGDYSLAPIAGDLDIIGVLRISMLPVLLTLFLIPLLDTLGTLLALGSTAGLADEQGNLPEIEKPMMVDAVSGIVSALVGTSTSGAYIESATGIREGARTGLAAVTVSALFVVSLFFIPLVEPLQELSFAYGPPLIVVGMLMMQSITRISFEDFSELVPAFVTIVMMVFTYNVANGLTAGLVLYPLLKLASGRWKEVKAGHVVWALLCGSYFLFGIKH